MRRKHIILSRGIAIGLLVCSAAWGQTVSVGTVVPIVPGSKATAGGQLGSFQYDPLHNVFYTATLGNPTGFRKYDVATDTATQMVFNSDLNRFAVTSNLTAGTCDSGDGGKQNPIGMLMNTSTLTVNGITYPPYTLVISNDNSNQVVQGGVTPRRDWTKKMYRWDLRAIGAATSVLPDYANAGNCIGGVTGAANIADWNDVFTIMVTEQDMVNVAGGLTGSLSQGRRPGLSTDGKSVYFTDSNATFGGVWKVNAETGALSWIYPNKISGTRIITEPAILSTSARDMDSLNTSTGDQIFFRGSTQTANIGGLDYLLDTGSGVLGPYQAFDQAYFDKFAEYNGRYAPRSANPDGSDPGVNVPDTFDIRSIASDPLDGTLYLHDPVSANGGATWRYDAQGRLSSVRSKDQLIRWRGANGGTQTTGQTLHLVLRHITYAGPGGVFDIPQLMWINVEFNAVVGDNVFKPGDFNRDNVVNAADRDLLLAKLTTPIETFYYCSTGSLPNCSSPAAKRYYEAPSDGAGTLLETIDGAAYDAYLQYDMNANGLVSSKDLTIFQKFYSPTIARCDFDADGDVDLDDFAHMQVCYKGAGSPQYDINCVDARLDIDTDVDTDDIAAFQQCFSGPKIPANLSCPF